MLVDVYGWFSGPSSAASTAGMFVPNAPMRVWDTRGPYRSPVWPNGTMEIGPTDTAAAQLWSQLAQASSLVFNLTVSEPAAAGFLTAYPARTPRPGTSTINWAMDETVANLAISPWSTAGVAFFSSGETDILVDITGYFTGVPASANQQRASNTAPGYTGESARDLVRDSIPASVYAVLGGVDMLTLPDLGGPAGYASTPPEAIRFSYQIYSNRRRIVARSAAAHEVGHILTYRYVDDTGIGLFWNGDEYECLAEALGRAMTAWTGRGYSPGYGGRYDAVRPARGRSPRRTRSFARRPEHLYRRTNPPGADGAVARPWSSIESTHRQGLRPQANSPSPMPSATTSNSTPARST